MKFHHTVAVFPDSDDLCGQAAVAEDDLSALLQFPAGLGQTLPFVSAQIPQQQQLGSAAGGAVAQQTGGQHPGIIHHQGVAGV